MSLITVIDEVTVGLLPATTVALNVWVPSDHPATVAAGMVADQFPPVAVTAVLL